MLADTLIGLCPGLDERRLWGDVPPGFNRRVDPQGGRLLVRRDQEPFISLSACRDSVHGLGTGRLQGRHAIGALALPGGDTALIRSYRHGGLLRRLTGAVFFTWPPRPFRELHVTEELRRRGVPTVEVYAAAVELLAGPFYRGWLVTRELAGAQDLWSALRSGWARELGLDQVLAAVAAGLRSLHRLGVYHRDLNLKNILIRLESGGVRSYIIDFDKAKLFSGAIAARLVERNVRRLMRSARRLDPEEKYFSAAERRRLIELYHAGDQRY